MKMGLFTQEGAILDRGCRFGVMRFIRGVGGGICFVPDAQSNDIRLGKDTGMGILGSMCRWDYRSLLVAWLPRCT